MANFWVVFGIATYFYMVATAGLYKYAATRINGLSDLTCLLSWPITIPMAIARDIYDSSQARRILKLPRYKTCGRRAKKLLNLGDNKVCAECAKMAKVDVVLKPNA